MLWALDSKDVDNLLLKRKECIGKKMEIEAVVSALSLIVSSLCTEYTSFGIVSSTVFKWFFFILGVGSLGVLVYDYVKHKDSYTYNSSKMYDEINKLNMIQREHSLLCIKNSDKYLVYFDERWSCYLFPNYKSKPVNNEISLIQSLAGDLNIRPNVISLKYVGQDLNEKYSVSGKVNKLYHHLLYKVEFECKPEWFAESDFMMNGKHYYWMTVNQLLHDKATYDHNRDIVMFVDSTVN